VGPLGHPQIKSVGGGQAFYQSRLHKLGQGHVHQGKKNLFDENPYVWKAHPQA